MVRTGSSGGSAGVEARQRRKPDRRYGPCGRPRGSTSLSARRRTLRSTCVGLTEASPPRWRAMRTTWRMPPHGQGSTEARPSARTASVRAPQRGQRISATAGTSILPLILMFPFPPWTPGIGDPDAQGSRFPRKTRANRAAPFRPRPAHTSGATLGTTCHQAEVRCPGEPGRPAQAGRPRSGRLAHGNRSPPPPEVLPRQRERARAAPGWHVVPGLVQAAPWPAPSAPARALCPRPSRRCRPAYARWFRRPAGLRPAVPHIHSSRGQVRPRVGVATH
jgi:hypothetical protein